MDLLESAADPEVRACLRERLLEAEERFGSCRERLESAEAFIARLRTRLEEQEARVARLAREGADTRLAEQLRQTAIETLALFESYRGQLQHAFDGSRP